jgi:DNA-binding NtrC family response regulator
VTVARLLLVDDDAGALSALLDLLQTRLYRIAIETVKSPQVALEHVRTTDYEVIVSDLEMPGMDGVTLMERVHQIRPQTPTLLMSGHIGEDIASRALNAGAYAFFNKPLDRVSFVIAVRRALQMRHLYRQVEDQNMLLLQYARALESVQKEHRLEARLRGMSGAVEVREEDSVSPVQPSHQSQSATSGMHSSRCSIPAVDFSQTSQR